jgi:hypothetical protein
MKKKTIFGVSRLRLSGLLVFAVLFTYPLVSHATGWETTGGGSFSCGGSGAYTVQHEEFNFLGITWSTRTTYRDGNNNEIAYPCTGAQL